MLTKSEIHLLIDILVDGRSDADGRDIYAGDIFKGSPCWIVYHKLVAMLEDANNTQAN